MSFLRAFSFGGIAAMCCLLLPVLSQAQIDSEGDGLGLGALLDQITEEVMTQEDSASDQPSAEPDDLSSEPEEGDPAEQGEPQAQTLEPEPNEPALRSLTPEMEAYLAAVEAGVLPAHPEQRPKADMTYEELQAKARLMVLGLKQRPEAPFRDEEEPGSAPGADPDEDEIDQPGEGPSVRSSSSDEASRNIAGLPVFPDYRPKNAPLHRIIPGSDDLNGILTVKTDGSRTLNSSNTSKPKDQEIPSVDAQCPARLRALGVNFTQRPNFTKPSGCQNQGIVRVTNFGSGVALNPNVDLTCAMAEGMALWLRNSVQDQSALYFGSRVVKLSNTHGYACRFRSGGRLSEHGFGNAIDIGTFHLADGRKVSVLDNWKPDGTPFGANASRWFDRINEDACDYFQLVLNPRSNKAHENHFHFDQGPWKSCD